MAITTRRRPVRPKTATNFPSSSEPFGDHHVVLARRAPEHLEADAELVRPEIRDRAKTTPTRSARPARRPRAAATPRLRRHLPVLDADQLLPVVVAPLPAGDVAGGDDAGGRAAPWSQRTPRRASSPEPSSHAVRARRRWRRRRRPRSGSSPPVELLSSRPRPRPASSAASAEPGHRYPSSGPRRGRDKRRQGRPTQRDRGRAQRRFERPRGR